MLILKKKMFEEVEFEVMFNIMFMIRGRIWSNVKYYVY